jgi:hypothetical protein
MAIALWTSCTPVAQLDVCTISPRHGYSLCIRHPLASAASLSFSPQQQHPVACSCLSPCETLPSSCRLGRQAHHFHFVISLLDTQSKLLFRGTHRTISSSARISLSFIMLHAVLVSCFRCVRYLRCSMKTDTDDNKVCLLHGVGLTCSRDIMRASLKAWAAVS